VAKRGDRAAPPPRGGEWDLLFADNAAAEGWDDLSKQAPGPLFEAWAHLRRDPRDRSINSARVHRLKGELGKRTIGGREFEQWQYEVAALFTLHGQEQGIPPRPINRGTSALS
jgi:hypothetical protein